MKIILLSMRLLNFLLGVSGAVRRECGVVLSSVVHAWRGGAGIDRSHLRAWQIAAVVVYVGSGPLL
jgi:hypothetical protein